MLVSKEVPEELESCAEVARNKGVGSVQHHDQHGNVESVEEQFLPGLHEVAAGDEFKLAVQPVEVALHALNIHRQLCAASESLPWYNRGELAEIETSPTNK